MIVHDIYGRPADLGNIAVLNASVANTNDAVQQYSSIIVSAIAKTALLFVPLIVKRVLSRSVCAVRWGVVTVAVLAVMYGIIMIKRGAPALIGFPKGFSYGFGSAALLINDAVTKQNYVEPIPLATYQADRLGVDNIVVVVDESIEYGAFKRLLAQDNFGDKTVDFGLAFSGANCSAPSNYIIRRAVWQRSVEDSLDIKETESLFKMAKQGGYKTSYIDNQGVLQDPTTRNYINADELKFIDNVVENTGPAYQRDMIAVDQIQQLIGQGKNFILINKNGAHFPYENTLEPKEVSSDNHKNYYKSVQVNAIDFLKKLTSIVSANTVVFYTSDHGQELNAKGSHCYTADDISIKEYTVPFLLMSGNETLLSDINTRLSVLENHLTHIELSESVRNMLGRRIDGINSIFEYKAPSVDYCGLYGHPLSFFGTRPS